MIGMSEPPFVAGRRCVLFYRCSAETLWGRVSRTSTFFHHQNRLHLRRVLIHRFALCRFIRLFRLPFEQRLILLALGDTRKLFH